MRGVIEAAARHPVFANLLMAVFLVGGAWGFSHMRAETFPDVSTELVQITYPYPGASAEEVEQGVILRVEEALQGLDGVEDVLSVARESVATVSIELEEATPAEQREVVDEVQDRIDAITNLPDSVEEPSVRELLIELPAALVVLHGPADEHTLRELAYAFKDGLRARGIAQVHLFGLRDPEITIEVSEEELRARGLSLNDVARVVEAKQPEPAGRVAAHRARGAQARGPRRADDRPRIRRPGRADPPRRHRGPAGAGRQRSPTASCSSRSAAATKASAPA